MATNTTTTDTTTDFVVRRRSLLDHEREIVSGFLEVICASSRTTIIGGVAGRRTLGRWRLRFVRTVTRQMSLFAAFEAGTLLLRDFWLWTIGSNMVRAAAIQAARHPDWLIRTA